MSLACISSPWAGSASSPMLRPSQPLTCRVCRRCWRTSCCTAPRRAPARTWPSGSGLTRLALVVAGDLVEDYPDGVWLIELAALADGALLPQAVASVLGVCEEAQRPLILTLVDALRSRALLLVLDNCEHLVCTLSIIWR